MMQGDASRSFNANATGCRTAELNYAFELSDELLGIALVDDWLDDHSLCVPAD